MSKDYGCLLIAILSNKSLYPLIDEEYENNKKEYDELILNSDFFNNNRHKIIPEDMKEYSIKLTGIFLSKNGNNFMRKILKLGWPRLYDYVKNTDCVVYEEIKQIKDYGLDNLSKGYTIYIIKQMLDMFNKDVTHKEDESKREINAYNKRLSLAWNIMIKEKLFQSLNEEFQLVLDEVGRDNTLQKRINLDKNSNFCKGLLYLMSYYSIDLWDFGQSYKIEEKDRELLASYLDASALSIDDILNNVSEKENMFDYIIFSRMFQVLINKYNALDSTYVRLYKNSIEKDIELEKFATQIYCLKEQVEKLERETTN